MHNISMSKSVFVHTAKKNQKVQKFFNISLNVNYVFVILKFNSWSTFVPKWTSSSTSNKVLSRKYDTEHNAYLLKEWRNWETDFVNDALQFFIHSKIVKKVRSNRRKCSHMTPLQNMQLSIQKNSASPTAFLQVNERYGL